MGIKDKLIQILGWYEVPSDDRTGIVDEIFAQFRCENCRHWEGTGKHGSFCGLITYNHEDADSAKLIGFDTEGNFVATKPDFFCKLFEAK